MLSPFTLMKNRFVFSFLIVAGAALFLNPPFAAAQDSGASASGNNEPVATAAMNEQEMDADPTVETDQVVQAAEDEGDEAVQAIPPAGKPVTETPSPKIEEDMIRIEKSGFYEKYLRDRLSIGTRVLWYSLTDTEQGEEFDGSFLGSLNRTEESQDLAPVYIYLEYAITPYFGLGISYDQFKVKTRDSGGGDGTV